MPVKGKNIRKPKKITWYYYCLQILHQRNIWLSGPLIDVKARHVPNTKVTFTWQKHAIKLKLDQTNEKEAQSMDEIIHKYFSSSLSIERPFFEHATPNIPIMFEKERNSWSTILIDDKT